MIKICRNVWAIGILGTAVFSLPGVMQGQFVMQVGDTKLNVAIGSFAKQQEDMIARKLAISPEIITVLNKDSTITITVKNTHYDVAKFSVKLYSAPPPLLILPDAQAKSGFTEVLSTGSGVNMGPDGVSSSESKAADSSAQKDLAPWISFDSKEMTVEPGKSKTFKVKMKAPANAAAGSYTTWVTAVVLIGPQTHMRASQEQQKPVMMGDKEVTFDIGGSSKPNLLLPEGAKILSATQVVFQKK